MENPTKTKLLAALRNAKHVKEPFNYWLLEDVLPISVCDAIANLPFAAPSGFPPGNQCQCPGNPFRR